MISGFYYRNILLKPKIEKHILSKAKKDKEVIYGARSIQKQIGIFSRSTRDWDIFTKNPKKSANVMQNDLDIIWGSDQYYSKPALHPGTYKVMNKGADMIQGTKDDYNVVDYSKFPSKKPRVIIKNGVRYRILSQEEKAKIRALKDNTQSFRHEKDIEDLNRIRLSKFKKLKGGRE